MAVDLGIADLGDIEEIGAGGNGVVYRARQIELDRLVAVKMVHLANNPETIERFNRECRTMARIAIHPGIAPIFASGTSATGKPYLIMPYYEAGSLSERMAAGPMPWTEAARIIVAVADAVEHAHAIDVIHRDLKPDNIMIDGRGAPVVVDFGIAKLVGSDSQSVGIHLTPSYAPPEAFDGTLPDRRYDVYSLGATLHALIAGKLPFPTEGGILHIGMQKATKPPPDLRVYAPHAVCECMERAMAIDPEARYQTAAEFGSALAEAAGINAPAPALRADVDDVLATQVAPQTPSAGFDPQFPAAAPGPTPSPPPQHPVSYRAPTPPPQQPAAYQTPTPPPQQPAAYQAPTPPPYQGHGFQAPSQQGAVQHDSYPGGYGVNSLTATTTGGATEGGGRSSNGFLIASLAAVAVLFVGGLVALVVLQADGETVTGPSSSVADGNDGTGSTTNEGVDDGRDGDEDITGIAEDRSSGDVIAKDLRPGDCFSLPTESGIFDTVELRACDAEHEGEVVSILQHPDAGSDYPGIDNLLDYATFPCADGFQQFVGTNDEFLTELQSGALYPTFDEWQDGIFVIPCFASRWDGEPLDFSVRGLGDDPAVNLDFGDLNGLDRLYIGDCFNELDDGLLLVPVRQTVELADCASLHDGEVVGFVDLVGPAGGAYDQDALIEEALAACTPLYTDYTGLELSDDIGLNGIVPGGNEWAAATQFAVCVVLKMEGGETGSIAG